MEERNAKSSCTCWDKRALPQGLDEGWENKKCTFWEKEKHKDPPPGDTGEKKISGGRGNSSW